MNKNTQRRKEVHSMLGKGLAVFPVPVLHPGTQVSLDIISTLNYVQLLLMHVGPMISAVLFILAGIFYAIGQLFPSHQRATFHTTAIDMIIGAIIVAVLSVTSNGFAAASAHLLTNVTNVT